MTAPRIAVLTGAGISAASGVPTFRGPEGLWRRYRAEDLATPGAFRADPKLVWEWYDWRRQLIASCQPNAAHRTVAAMETTLPPGHFTLITQNVDGLHDIAGSRNVLHLHGDIWHVRCTQCGWEGINRETPLPELPPPCPQCGGLLRPGVVWFGENIPEKALQSAWQAAGHCDLMLVIGTSALVYPAAAIPSVAKEHGARLIEFNIAETPLSSEADQTILGPVEETLPVWWEKWKASQAA